MYLRHALRYAAIAVTAVGLFCSAASRASAEATLLIEADTGKVLQADNAGYPWHPASLTKLMTAYVILQAVKTGRITLDTPFTVSALSLAQPPTKMGFKVGTVVTVDNALKMLLVKSANDMAVLLAEGLDGSIDKFSEEMNATAARLGMTQTNYVNPNGLPDDRQVTSARDLGILSRAIYKDLPEYAYFWHLPGIKFGHRVVRNYNKLLELYPGADGMKTGFICASGFNLVASATRNNRRLIAVVLGAPSSAVRAYKAAKLLEQGFTGSNKLAWLIPSKGTVDQLPAIDAPPPDLREEMCGPHRKRPAAEDEEVDMSSVSEDGKTNPLAFMLSSLHGTVKAGKVLGAAIASLPPVDVFVGAFKPGSAVAAEKQESQLAGWSPKKRAARKAKAAKTKTAAASGDKPDKADARDAAKKEGAKPASSEKAAAKPAKPARPAAKPAAAKSAATTATTKQ